MPEVVDNVNMPYHHGHLREALVEAGLALARESGPDAVVLRAVTRAAGVSHNAAYRHFADRDELLRAVCVRCMGELAARIRARIDELPAEADPASAALARLEATGRPYIEFALDEPGWFRTAFGVPHVLEPIQLGEGGNPYALLVEALDGLTAAGLLPAERRPRAEYAAWSGVHGISTLLLDGPLRGLPADERAAAIDTVIAVVIAGLTRP